MKLSFLTVCLFSAIFCSSCQYPATLRRMNPIRSSDGKSEIALERTKEKTTLSWRLVKLADVYASEKTNAANDLYEAQAQLQKYVDPSTWSKEGQPASVVCEVDAEGTTVQVPKGGEYGEVYLLQVLEREAKQEGKQEGEGAGGKIVRNTVTTHDDRDQALAVGAEVGLLFLPELDATVTSTQVSIFPSRLWAVNRRDGTSISWFTDQLSIDVGIVGASVIGDAPEELGGRTAFTIGLGYLLAKGWAFKAGLVLYRDASLDANGDTIDDLTDSAYWGLSYDLLSGLVQSKK